MSTFMCSMETIGGKKIHPDPVEVQAYDWKEPQDILQEIQDQPHKYAAWFVHYMEHHFGALFSHLKD